MSEEMKINMRDIARSGHVTRWHSVRTARDQTLAEHHFMVTMIIRKLVQMLLGEKITAEEYITALEYGLTHDQSEIIMGDLPSPLKRRMENILGDQPNPLDIIEKQLDPETAVLKEKLEGTPLKYIAKIADLIDAYVFIREEGIGTHAEETTDVVQALINRKLSEAASAFPDIRWLESLNLIDEMTKGPNTKILFEMS